MVKIFQPQEIFRPIIEFFYEIDFEAGTKSILPQKVLPCGHTMIIFTRKGCWLYSKEKILIQLPAAYVTGQADRFFYIKPSLSLCTFGIAFKPHAFKLLFGWNLDEFKDKIFRVDEVFENDGNLLTEKIFNAKDVKECIKIFEDFLLFYHQRKAMGYENHIILEAIQTINLNHGNISVHNLSAHLHMSERHLERLFKHHIGLSPKKWTILMRNIHLMELLYHEHISALTLTAWLNYFDHSHFYRDFYRFSGEHFGHWNEKSHSFLNKLLQIDFLGPH